jgi:hypothetical protein
MLLNNNSTAAIETVRIQTSLVSWQRAAGSWQ